jgi:hypothetical protein
LHTSPYVVKVMKSTAWRCNGGGGEASVPLEYAEIRYRSIVGARKLYREKSSIKKMGEKNQQCDIGKINTSHLENEICIQNFSF